MIRWTNWKQKGLKAPKAQAQWVQINDKYMMVMITNGTIVDHASGALGRKQHLAIEG